MCKILECAKHINLEDTEAHIQKSEEVTDEKFEEEMNKQLNMDDMSNVDHGKWDDKEDYTLPPKRKVSIGNTDVL